MFLTRTALPSGVLQPSPDGAILSLKVVPRAGRSGLAEVRDGVLRVRLHAAPVDGAANEELIEVLADALSLPKRAVTIVSGERSRTKRVRLSGLDVRRAEALIAAALAAGS